jgi:uncharacterized membrane protein
MVFTFLGYAKSDFIPNRYKFKDLRGLDFILKQYIYGDMTASEFETLRDELRAMRHDLDRLAIKLDDKPNIAKLYQAIVVLMFGIGTVIAAAAYLFIRAIAIAALE